MSPSLMEFLPFLKKVWAGMKLRFQGAGGPACLNREMVTRPPVGPRPYATSGGCHRAPEMRQEEAPKMVCAWGKDTCCSLREVKLTPKPLFTPRDRTSTEPDKEVAPQAGRRNEVALTRGFRDPAF